MRRLRDLARRSGRPRHEAANRERGTTLVVVTHDLELSRRAHRIVHLKAGRIDPIEVAGDAGSTP